MERRLAAVLIADVVGYVRLSQADEEGTRARFQADQREVFEPAIAAHHGRLVKTMGDALLVEFQSVVDALRCAVAVQRLKAERNAALPAAQRLVYRIGINLGDVIVEGDDIHGDGVNIADRLQELADPGGIAISGTAYDQVKTKVEVGYAFLGEQPVKHVAELVRVYRVLLDPAAAGRTIIAADGSWRTRRWPRIAAAAAAVLALAGTLTWLRPWEPKIEAAAIERMALPLPDKPSIIVLPFDNLSGNVADDYFADGMTEDLTTDLSHLAGLFVISRNTAFTYKGKAILPAQVAEEVGVRYILEGSVRRGGDEVRINAQLIDALSGGHVWADRYDGSVADIFALQDKVTNAIVDALALRLTNAEQLALKQQETSVPAAYDALLRGWEHYRRTTPEDYAKAIPYFEEAVRLDPEYGRAYAALATVYLRSYGRDYAFALGLSNIAAYQKAKDYLAQAQSHPTSTSHQVNGYFLMNSEASNAAIAEFKEAIVLDPNDSWSYLFLAVALTASGRASEALPHVRTALRLDPHPPSIFLYYLGLVQFALQEYGDAAASLESAFELNPEDLFTNMMLGATYGQLGRTAEAKSAIARYNELRVRYGFMPLSVAWSNSMWLNKSADRNRLKKGLRLAGVPEFLVTGEFAKENTLPVGEIRSLFFGHTLHGRNLYDGQERAATVTAEGMATLSGDWGSLTDAVVEFDGDQLCYARAGDTRLCGTVLRIPGGTREKENEFIWFDSRDAFTFSQIQ